MAHCGNCGKVEAHTPECFIGRATDRLRQRIITSNGDPATNADALTEAVRAATLAAVATKPRCRHCGANETLPHSPGCPEWQAQYAEYCRAINDQSRYEKRARAKDGVTVHTVLDIRSYDVGLEGDWNGDVPQEVRRELMEVAQRTHMSLDYLCAIYRKGATDVKSRS